MPQIIEETVPGEEVESGGAPPAATPSPPVFDAICGISEGDYTGASAVLDAIEAGETKIGVRPGTYDCSTLGNVAGEIGSSTNQLSGVSIVGLGAGPGDVIIKRPTASPFPLYVHSDLSLYNLTLEDVRFEWNDTAEENILFDRVHFTRNILPTLMYLDSGSSAIKNFKMTNCEVFGTSSPGASIFIYTDGCQILNCRFTDMKGDILIYSKDGSYGLFDSNYIENSYGVKVESDGGTNKANFTFSNNHFELGAGDRWFWSIQLTGNVNNVDVINNRFIRVDGFTFSSSHSNCRFVGNHIEDTVNAYHGIEISGKLTDCEISGNTIIGSNRLNMDGISDGTSLTHERTKICNNTFINWAKYGIYMYGMNDSDVSGNILDNCDYGLSLASQIFQTKVNHNTINNVIASQSGIDVYDVTDSQIIGNVMYNDTLITGSKGILVGGSVNGMDISNNRVDKFAVGIKVVNHDFSRINNNTVSNVAESNDGIQLTNINNSHVNGNILRNDSLVTGSNGIYIGGAAINSDNYDVSHNNITNFATDLVDTPAKAQTLGNL